MHAITWMCDLVPLDKKNQWNVCFVYVKKWQQRDNWFFCWCRELFHSCGTAPKNFASALSASARVRQCHWGCVLGVEPSLHRTGCALAFIAAGNLIGIQDWHSAPICSDSPLCERPWKRLNNINSSRESIIDIHKSSYLHILNGQPMNFAEIRKGKSAHWNDLMQGQVVYMSSWSACSELLKQQENTFSWTHFGYYWSILQLT